jgi:hypothetical protein
MELRSNVRARELLTDDSNQLKDIKDYKTFSFKETEV